MRLEHVYRQHEEHSCRGSTSSRAPEGAMRREQVHRQHEEHSCRGSTSSRAPEGAMRREQVHRQHEEHSCRGSTSSGAPEGAVRRERQYEEHSSTNLLRPREQHDGNAFAVNKRRTRQRRWFGWFQDFHQPRKRKEERLPIALDTKGIEKSEGVLKDLCYRENREPKGFVTRIFLSHRTDQRIVTGSRAPHSFPGQFRSGGLKLRVD